MPTLSETGQILVTQAAARQYGEARGLQTEEARRELTTLLTGAKPTATPPRNGLEGWRIRSRSLGVDVGAHVSREGVIASVVHVQVRTMRARNRRDR